MASKMISVREGVYRRLKRRKGHGSFSDAIEAMIEETEPVDVDEHIRDLQANPPKVDFDLLIARQKNPPRSNRPSRRAV